MSNPMQSVQDALSGGTWRERSLAGAVAGLAGGIVMGVILHLGTDLLPVIGRLAGSSTHVRGWTVHLIVSVLYGLVYPVFVSVPFVKDVATTVGAHLLLGVVHASALSFVTIGLVVPVATLIFGFPESPFGSLLVPGPGPGTLVAAGFFGLGHVLYGVALGGVYAVLRGLRTG